MTAQKSPLEALIHSTQAGDATLCKKLNLKYCVKYIK